MKKLAIVTTHPIQYNAPVFKMLAERKMIQPKVFYTWENAQNGFYDQKFKQEIEWDIPLLEGYDYQFVKNTSSNQGSHHRKGIVNPTLIKEIEEWKADTVLIFGWNFHSHFKAMKYFKGKIPVYFRGDSTILNDKPGIKTILRRIWLTYIYRFIDYAFYVGTNNREYFIKHGLSEKQLIFAPHAIDNERFYNSRMNYEQQVNEWKDKLGIKPTDLVFLFAGKFENKKDPLLLVEAAKQNSSQNTKYLFAGNGELKKSMKIQSKENNNILFIDFQNQSQMPLLYQLADVFILPSKGPGETWGLSVNEAMCCGKAILVSDKVGCAVDLVDIEKNGYIFESGNLIDLVEKIKKFNKTNVHSFGNYSLLKIKEYNYNYLSSTIEKQLIEKK